MLIVTSKLPDEEVLVKKISPLDALKLVCFKKVINCLTKEETEKIKLPLPESTPYSQVYKKASAYLFVHFLTDTAYEFYYCKKIHPIIKKEEV